MHFFTVQYRGLLTYCVWPTRASRRFNGKTHNYTLQILREWYASGGT